MRTLKAIIFDMDGVIIDSEPQHGRAALKVLHKYGVDADMSYHEQFIGSSTANMAQKVISDFSLSLSPEEAFGGIKSSQTRNPQRRGVSFAARHLRADPEACCQWLEVSDCLLL